MSGALSTIVDALAGKREGSSYRCLCPVHNGRSLIVTEKNGRILFKCQNGCEQNDVLDALRQSGLWESGAPANGAQPTPSPTQPEVLEDQYEYRDAAGAVVAIKGRFRTFGDKTFKWRLSQGDEEWTGLHGLKELDLPLFGAHLLAESDGPVFVTEGEKAAKACQAVGLTVVCAAGGSSQRNFGQALAVLQGREVVVWPDNDDGGRDLMRRIGRELAGVAESVRFVHPDVPPKGDAFDYFGKGGTVDALLETLASVRTKPWVKEIPDGYLVSLPEDGGLIRFEFRDLGGHGRSVDAALSVWQEIPGVTGERFTARLSLASLNNREAFRRQLDEMYGKDGAWTSRLNRACELAQDAHLNRDESVPLIDAAVTELADYLFRPFVVGDGPSIIFGPGGSAKTFFALAIAVCVSLGLRFMGQDIQQAGVLYVDYESSASTLKKRMLRLLKGFGMENSIPALFYWPARGLPLADIAPALERKVRTDAIGLVIIDSAILAAGGDPERAETAARFFNALDRIGVPSLILSHVTKSDDDRHPFGSIFWSNSARLTWSTKIIHEEDGVVRLGLFHRKANDDRLEKPIGLRLVFQGQDGPVRFAREELAEEWESELGHAERLRRELRAGSRSVKQLAKALDIRDNTVRATLSRMKDAASLETKAADGSGLWGLLAQQG